MATNIVALYDDLSTAQQVVRALHDIGIPSADISLVASDAAGEYGKYLTKTTTKVNDTTADGVDTGAGVGALLGGLGGLLVGLGALAIPGIGPVLAAGPLATAVAAIVGAGVGAAAGGAVGGIIGGLIDLGIPEEQAHYYAEGIRRGGTLLTVHTHDGDTDRALEIMNSYNPIDIEERAAAWRQEGWTGYDMKAKPYTVAQITKERARYAAPVSTTPPAATNIRAGDEARFPVVEEKLAVGKRQVKGGEVRVRKYVIETPVEESIDLRQEHVSVERRPVDRPASPDMLNAMKDETLEVTETREEAVVEKQARVVEEVVVRKDVENQTKKVRDTVRRTDVEVDRSGTNMTMDEYRTNWRNHYQKNFGTSGMKYEQYEPAYQYGYDLRGDKRYSGWDWVRLEPQARKDWETRYPGSAWDKAKLAVRYAWESVKDAVTD